MVVLHIYATYQPYISYGYENFPPDKSKSVILAFKMAADPFCVQVGPMEIHAHTQFGNSSLYGYENIPRKLIRLRTTDGRL